MRTWVRARISVRCGCCGATVPTGEPVLEMLLKGTRTKAGEPIGVIDVKRALYRCRLPECAGEAVPDLVVIQQPPMLPPLARFSVDSLPKDFKALQAGEREVGEEG
jgi:hypothetical protein